MKYFSENAYWNLASFKREKFAWNLLFVPKIYFFFFFWVTEMSGFTWLYIYIYCWGLFPLQASSEETILEEEIIREANSQLLSLKNIGQMTNPLQHLAHYLWAGNFNREMTLCKSCWSCMKVLFLLKLKDHNDRQTKMNFCAFSLSWW